VWRVQSELSLASLAVEPSNGHVDPGLLAAAQTRTVTGVLTSRPTSRDIKIDGFSMGLNGVELIQARGGPARARPLSTACGPGRTLLPPPLAPRPPALCLGKPLNAPSDLPCLIVLCPPRHPSWAGRCSDALQREAGRPAARPRRLASLTREGRPARRTARSS